ncbi:MAG: hypothetical protein ACRDNE_00555 [Gaiellaceae bacterium]
MPPDPTPEQNFMERLNAALRAYLSATEQHGELVHRDLVADAFVAGMQASVTFPVSEDEIATEFELYCEAAYTE